MQPRKPDNEKEKQSKPTAVKYASAPKRNYIFVPAEENSRPSVPRSEPLSREPKVTTPVSTATKRQSITIDEIYVNAKRSKTNAPPIKLDENYVDAKSSRTNTSLPSTANYTVPLQSTAHYRANYVAPLSSTVNYVVNQKKPVHVDAYASEINKEIADINQLLGDKTKPENAKMTDRSSNETVSFVTSQEIENQRWLFPSASIAEIHGLILQLKNEHQRLDRTLKSVSDHYSISQQTLNRFLTHYFSTTLESLYEEPHQRQDKTKYSIVSELKECSLADIYMLVNNKKVKTYNDYDEIKSCIQIFRLPKINRKNQMGTIQVQNRENTKPKIEISELSIKDLLSKYSNTELKQLYGDLFEMPLKDIDIKDSRLITNEDPDAWYQDSTEDNIDYLKEIGERVANKAQYKDKKDVADSFKISERALDNYLKYRNTSYDAVSTQMNIEPADEKEKLVNVIYFSLADIYEILQHGKVMAGSINKDKKKSISYDYKQIPWRKLMLEEGFIHEYKQAYWCKRLDQALVNFKIKTADGVEKTLTKNILMQCTKEELATIENYDKPFYTIASFKLRKINPKEAELLNIKISLRELHKKIKELKLRCNNHAETVLKLLINHYYLSQLSFERLLKEKFDITFDELYQTDDIIKITNQDINNKIPLIEHFDDLTLADCFILANSDRVLPNKVIDEINKLTQNLYMTDHRGISSKIYFPKSFLSKYSNHFLSTLDIYNKPFKEIPDCYSDQNSKQRSHVSTTIEIEKEKNDEYTTTTTTTTTDQDEILTIAQNDTTTTIREGFDLNFAEESDEEDEEVEEVEEVELLFDPSLIKMEPEEFVEANPSQLTHSNDAIGFDLNDSETSPAPMETSEIKIEEIPDELSVPSIKDAFHRGLLLFGEAADPIIIKEEIQRLTPLELNVVMDKLRELIMQERISNPADTNCGHWAEATIVALPKLLQGQSNVPFKIATDDSVYDGSTVVEYYKQKVDWYDKNGKKVGDHTRMTGVKAIPSQGGLHSKLPPVTETTNEGVVQINADPNDVPMDEIKQTDLTHRLKEEAKNQGGILIGQINLYRPAKRGRRDADNPGHTIIFVATEETVYYIDPHLCKPGDPTSKDPIFIDDLAMHYTFVTQDKRTARNQYLDDVFYLVYWKMPQPKEGAALSRNIVG